MYKNTVCPDTSIKSVYKKLLSKVCYQVRYLSVHRVSCNGDGHFSRQVAVRAALRRGLLLWK